MELMGVRVELSNNTPIVLLREVGGEHRVLPIYIGGPEATAIALAVEGVVTPRPMTHDLLQLVLEELATSVERITVTELRESTFYAEMLLRNGQGEHVISCRPSDAIALAVRVGAPIFADESVIDAVGYTVEEGDDKEQVVEEFREFIENVSPEDFAS